MKYTTEDALSDALYVRDYAAQIAAALDRGDYWLAGRALGEAVRVAKREQAEIDALRAEDARDAFANVMRGSTLADLIAMLTIHKAVAKWAK